LPLLQRLCAPGIRWPPSNAAHSFHGWLFRALFRYGSNAQATYARSRRRISLRSCRYQLDLAMSVAFKPKSRLDIN
jgi:hypothetical protein